jgi:drug/metabolite transporter (DMT)-like permease
VPQAPVLAAFAATVGLFGVNFVAIRFAVADLDPTWTALLRFAPGAALLTLIALVARASWPHGRGLAAAATFGVLAFGLASMLIFWALTRISAGAGSLIFATIPLATFLIAVGVRQESFRWQGLAGAGLAIAGIAVISGSSITGGQDLAPTLAAVAAAALVAGAGVVIKAVPPMHPVTVNAVGMAAASGFLLVGTIVLGERIQVPTAPATVTALVWLVLSASAATVLIIYVLNRWTASATAYQTVLSPAVTVMVAAALLAEPVTYTLAVGGALVVAGTWVGAIWQGRRRGDNGAVRL